MKSSERPTSGPSDYKAMTSTDLSTQFLRPNLRAQRQIVTPEGVPLSVELASLSERAVAFVIDLAIWLLASIAVDGPVAARARIAA